MNIFGSEFRVSIFGESHSPAVGCVVDGLPAGIFFDLESFEQEISRRKSGGFGTTTRLESDHPKIISGYYENHTTGSPVTILFDNVDARSQDYSQFKVHPRPGHADFAAGVKHKGLNDIRGGGHFSGRLTLPLVAAGFLAKAYLKELKIEASILSVGGELNWETKLKNTILEMDSLGGLVECRVKGVPIGWGEPFFNSVESLLSHIVFSIPGVRGVEFGDGFAAGSQKGSEQNDLLINKNGQTFSNHSGGINGGITNGNDLIMRVAFKPTSTIAKEQVTYNFEVNKLEPLSAPGRHDVAFVLRTPVIVEAVTAIVLADLKLINLKNI